MSDRWKKGTSGDEPPPTGSSVPPVPHRARSPEGSPADPVELIDACRRGDRAAIEAVLRPLLPALERLLVRLVANAADAEDLIQTTVAAAIVAFPRFRGESTVKTWLCRIATYQVREHWRSPSRRRRAALELVPDDDRSGPHTAPLAIAGRADAQLDARRRLDRLYHHLASISAAKRIAFVLHVIDGRPMEEVAAIMDASLPATKSRVLWARRAVMAKAKKDPLLADLVRGEDAP
jgi:RNA polymerase sigma-70 factor (ECF subfamily)